MTDIPRLDYHAKAVADVLYADDTIHDPFAICDVLDDGLANNYSAYAVVRAYGADAAVGDLICDAPDLAWDFVETVRRSEPILYDRANERFRADQVPECYWDDFDAAMCYMATLLVELKAEDEIEHAISVLHRAVRDGRLTELSEGA